jgi:phage shock protein PspC (stress-responsive transcriptional regulator)
MKKTVNVNVGGYSFILEEMAYEQLNMYLNNVRRNLGNDVDANEVMNDIESRIAELFREALRENGREVVDSALIDRVIAVMGKPEDYGDGTETQQQQYQHSGYQETVPRALFRDPDNKMLGGVAAGLANYFGWDPLAIRIIFVLLLFGFGVVDLVA